MHNQWGSIIQKLRLLLQSELYKIKESTVAVSCEFELCSFQHVSFMRRMLRILPQQGRVQSTLSFSQTSFTVVLLLLSHLSKSFIILYKANDNMKQAMEKVPSQRMQRHQHRIARRSFPMLSLLQHRSVE